MLLKQHSIRFWVPMHRIAQEMCFPQVLRNASLHNGRTRLLRSMHLHFIFICKTGSKMCISILIHVYQERYSCAIHQEKNARVKIYKNIQRMQLLTENNQCAKTPQNLQVPKILIVQKKEKNATCTTPPHLGPTPRPMPT